MGAGLYYTPTGETVYAEPSEGIELDDDGDDYIMGGQEQRDDAYDDFLTRLDECTISNAFPSWYVVAPTTYKYGRDGARILYRSKLHQVTLYEDDYSRLHVSVELHDDLEDKVRGLAQRSLKASAARIFRNLAEHYKLRQRDTAWTSKLYNPIKEESKS